MKKFALKDVCEIIPGYAFKASNFGTGNIFVVKIKDINPPYINIENCECVSVEPDERFSLQKGDFVMAMTGATIGKIGKLWTSYKKLYINQRVCKFLPLNCVKDYLYYLLNTNSFITFVHNNVDSKLAQPNIGHPTLYKFEHLFPSIEEQQSIANALSQIDIKIHLNKAINHNLEAMAKQLYDYWFVQFDFPDENGRPYKSSGGKMVWNEKLKREIPEGWKVKELHEVVEIKNGATPSTTDENNYGGDVVWITPKDLSCQQSKFIYQGERNITRKGYENCSTSLLPIGSVLLSSRAPIGLLAIAREKLCTNQGFKNLVPSHDFDTHYLYYYVKYHISQIEQLGTGTTFKEVSKDDLYRFPILTYDNSKMSFKEWEKVMNQISDKQFVLIKEIAKLTKLRDELLPLLMNGQVSVNYDLSR